MAEELTVKKQTAVSQVKAYLSNDNIKQRFNDILGKKAPTFMASIVNAVSASSKLQECDPSSIMGASFVAASFDLPIDQNLGYAAIVPYKCSVKDPKTGRWNKVDRAQFQMMYKGFIQLAIRSGRYEKMNCSEVYEDELVSFNPITGEVDFVKDFSATKQRSNGEDDKIVGYYAWFRLKEGFTHELYMTKEQVMNHAKKYSTSYMYDINENKKSSRWSTDFDAMAKKTVIKLLLNKWGILSIEMQKAIEDDQKVYDENEKGEYSDNMPEIVEATDPFEDKVIDAKAEEIVEEIDITE